MAGELEGIARRRDTWKDVVDQCLALLRAHGMDNDGGPADLVKEIESLQSILASLVGAARDSEDKARKLREAGSRSNNKIEQTLAQALGCYPWYKDDQENFPGATEADGVCIGEHVAESIAAEAARIIRSLQAEVARLRDALMDAADALGCIKHPSIGHVERAKEAIRAALTPPAPGRDVMARRLTL